jgi:hypothetical protein
MGANIQPPSVAFEIKYALPAWRADAVAAWLDARCTRDPQYPEGHVRSLYLDTPDLRYLTEKVDGDFLKTKIRLRWYAADERAPAAGPVWLEIKRRENLSRSKTRIPFHDRATDLDQADPESIDVGRAIHLVRDQGLDAPTWLRPALALSYSRSRWIDQGTGDRIALDRVIQPTWGLGRCRPPASVPELRTAVVEFKGREPDVPRALRGVTDFGGRRTSLSKYFSCYVRLFAGAMSDDGGII